MSAVENRLLAIERRLGRMEMQLQLTAGAIHEIAKALGIRETLEKIAEGMDELNAAHRGPPHVADVREG